MKKLFAWSLVLALVVGLLSGCGKKEEDKETRKKAKKETTETSETEQEACSLVGVWEYGTDCAYAFGEKGIGVYRFFGIDQAFSYIDNGDSVTILYEGNIMESEHAYTIEGDVLSIADSFGDFVEYTRGKDGSVEIPGKELPMPGQQGQASVSGDYQWWAGQWYGWWCMYDATGLFAPLNNTAWDAYGDIQVAEDAPEGHIRIWDTVLYDAGCLVTCDVSFEEGWGEHGAMSSQNGQFFVGADWELQGIKPVAVSITEDQWQVDPAMSTVSHFDNMLEICGTYIDPENSQNTFSYRIYLRPWGTDWSDVSTGDTSGCIYNNMMPVYYEQWYLPLVNSYPDNMPSSFKAGLDLMEE